MDLACLNLVNQLLPSLNSNASRYILLIFVGLDLDALFAVGTVLEFEIKADPPVIHGKGTFIDFIGTLMGTLTLETGAVAPSISV